MAGPESRGGGFESFEGSGERFGGGGKYPGCLRWAIEVKYGDTAADGAGEEATTVIRNAVVAYTDTSFQLACGKCAAGCELVFSGVQGEPPEAKPLVTGQGITNLLICEQA
jgi:hypothetical protein